MRRSGALSDVHSLWDLVGTGAMSGSVEEILEHHKPSFDRLPSINAFDKVSVLTTCTYSAYNSCLSFDNHVPNFPWA